MYSKSTISGITIFLGLLNFISCNGQADVNEQVTSKKVGGPCEGCEAIYEFGDKKLKATDTLPLFSETNPKLIVSGTVYEQDGKTPAKDVILYIYHTNRQGVYQKKGDEKGWARRHGFIRGWIKTDSTGKYTFYTFRPGAYADRSEPEHIHLTVKEPGRNEYYLDDFVFKDDTLVTEKIKNRFTQRGGSGIVEPKFKNGILHVERDITLGLNIPNYY